MLGLRNYSTTTTTKVQNSTEHCKFRFLAHFFTLTLHDYRVKFPDAMTTKFAFSYGVLCNLAFEKIAHCDIKAAPTFTF